LYRSSVTSGPAFGDETALDAAFATLGVERSCTRSEARGAFRRLLGLHHPDRHDGDVHSVATTRTIIEAFSLVNAEFARTNAPRQAADCGGDDDESHLQSDGIDIAGDPRVRKLDADTLALFGTLDESYVRLLDVGHLVGDVTYVDRQNGLFESMLRTIHGDAVSLVCTLQGRADETAEAFFTMEPLGVALHELPNMDGITELIAHHLRNRW
jgi:hypothetical protein